MKQRLKLILEILVNATKEIYWVITTKNQQAVHRLANRDGDDHANLRFLADGSVDQLSEGNARILAQAQELAEIQADMEASDPWGGRWA